MRRSLRKTAIKVRGQVKCNYKEALNFHLPRARKQSQSKGLFKVRFVGLPFEDADGVKCVKVHYLGYSSQYDEVKKLGEIVAIGTSLQLAFVSFLFFLHFCPKIETVAFCCDNTYAMQTP